MPSQHTAKTTVRRLATEVTALPTTLEVSRSKALILDVALRLFAENGYNGASIRDIAAAADLKPASIYAHYRSKEQILAQLIDIGHEQHFHCVQGAVANSDPAPKQQLRAYVEAHVRFHTEFSMLAMLVNNELHALSEDYVSSALQLRELSIKVVMDIVHRGAETGDFVIGHDPWLAGAAIGAMGMRVANWYSEHHEQSVDDIVAAYQDFACRLVGAK